MTRRRWLWVAAGAAALLAVAGGVVVGLKLRSAEDVRGSSTQEFVTTAAPKPNQPGSISRHCDHENTQGIARRSSIAVVFLREAGRLPILSSAISLMTVDSQKYCSKPGVS